MAVTQIVQKVLTSRVGKLALAATSAVAIGSVFTSCETKESKEYNEGFTNVDVFDYGALIGEKKHEKHVLEEKYNKLKYDLKMSSDRGRDILICNELSSISREISTLDYEIYDLEWKREEQEKEANSQ